MALVKVKGNRLIDEKGKELATGDTLVFEISGVSCMGELVSIDEEELVFKNDLGEFTCHPLEITKIICEIIYKH